MSNESQPMPQNDFEAMLRRYLAKLARRYAPVLAALVVLALIIVLIPTTQPTSTLTANGVVGSNGGQVTPGGSAAGGAGAAGGSSSGASSGSSAGSASGAGGASSSFTNGTYGGSIGSAASGGAGGATATGGSGGSSGASGGTAAGGSQSGVARTGVTCGRNVRQFSWSGRSPYCVAAFHGNNGGATASGVTANTITLTFRIPNSAEDDTIAALAGTANVNYPAMIADLKTYINYFNSQFELYGRHVVLKAYNGQGDYIQEDQGQNLGAAQADAVSAHDMGAFGDITFSLGASQPYEEDLAAEHVISFSSVAQPESWYLSHAPYEFSVQGGSGSNAIQEAAAVVCRRLAGMPAIFAGDVLMQHTNRVFGIIYPETPDYSAEAAQYKQILSGCGVSVAKTVAYAINVAQYTQQALSTVALMKAAGVTTVLCACDPIFPILLTPAASTQGYHPEWFGADFGDAVTQDYTQSDWKEVAGGAAFPPPAQTEAYHAYQLANPGHQPAEDPPTSPPYYYVPYYTLLQVFEGLQAAGPDLTPATFEAGTFALPPSVGSDPIGGQWVSGNGVFDPVVSFGLVWWNPNGTSDFDGKAGTYVACNGGQTYTVSDLAALGPPGHQLNCFGH